MATGESIPLVSVSELAAALLVRPEVAIRSKLIAEHVVRMVGDSAAVVWVIEDQENPAWTPAASAGEVTPTRVEDFMAGTLGSVAQTRALLSFEAASLPREDFAHLDIRRTAHSLTYAPLLMDDQLVGAIEWISFAEPFSAPALQAVSELTEVASPAVAAAMSYEAERNSNLQSISRVTQMYDLEKVFNSTLEMEPLLEMIAKKFQEVLNVQAVNLWMVGGDALELVSQAGYDPTLQVGMVEKPGEGIAAEISESGEPVLIEDAQDERLQKRNAGVEEGGIFSVVAAPLMELENLVGVVEAVNRLDGQPFDDDDQFLLMSISETASNALHNADLLQAERKVEVLEALVKVSGEITSTLDLDRVLHAIVTEPGNVISYERAAIALEQRGRLQLRAVTGVVHINTSDPEIVRLQNLLEWASLSRDPILITQHGEEVEDEREETRAKFQAYFEQTGMRGFHSVPLADDDGRVGILAFESRDPDFLNTAHLEMIKVLAGQATVALRNASLYREVPFIDVLEPILAKKRKFLALEKRRRALLVAGVVAVVVFLAAVPLPLRVDGPATVSPARTAKIQPEVAGIVQRVNVHEGDYVRKGTPLANIDDWTYRAALSSAQAKYDNAVSQMDRALAGNDGTEAGIQRVQAEYWKGEVARDQERLANTVLRSPIDGRVATPHIENLVGRELKEGDTFAEIVETQQATVDVAIDELDVARLQAGEKAAIKLEGIPNKTYRSKVAVVSPESQLQGNERYFFARIPVDNQDGLIRPGMQGRAKISTGWSSAGWVLFRRPLMWMWAKIWGWVGW